MTGPSGGTLKTIGYEHQETSSLKEQSMGKTWYGVFTDW